MKPDTPWLAPVAEPKAPEPGALDRSGTRLAIFAVALVLALVGGFAIGRATGAAEPMSGSMPGATGPAGDGHAHGGTGPPGNPDNEIGGLTVSAAGYQFVPRKTIFAVGTPESFAFEIRGPDLTPVNKYVVVHERELHLVVARRDLSGYQHLHPERSSDGTWSVPLTLSTPGWYRAFADFTVVDANGQQVKLTLAVDLTVPGNAAPLPLSAPTNSITVDGQTVSYDGTAQVGATIPVNMRVSPGPAERYLGSYGHLVVLREGDLAYLHVHPEEQMVGGAVRFWLAAPSRGRYRAFFDFQVGGKVRTAEFTMVVS